MFKSMYYIYIYLYILRGAGGWLFVCPFFPQTQLKHGKCFSLYLIVHSVDHSQKTFAPPLLFKVMLAASFCEFWSMIPSNILSTTFVWNIMIDSWEWLTIGRVRPMRARVTMGPQYPGSTPAQTLILNYIKITRWQRPYLAYFGLIFNGRK